MRKVMYCERGKFDFSNEGKFHQWGTYSNGDGIVTCAIIEDTNGRIYCIDPWEVKFIEDEKA